MTPSLEAPSAPAPPTINPWIVAISVMLATFMEVLDTTVVNVSLPHIAGNLSASIDEATWTLTSYLVANAIILPITGWLARTFGRKRLLLTAVMGFAGASFLCGLAMNLPMLIVFRIVQGATGGVLQPVSQAVMLEAFPPQERGKAMAFWGLGIVVAPMLGPVLGGYLTDNYSWRWIFYINLPIGLASVIMTRLFIFDPPYLRRESSGIDYWGLGTLAVGIGALQVFLDKGQEDDWFSSHFIVALALVSAVMLAGFIAWELWTRQPVVNLRVFRVRTYATGTGLMALLGFVLYGSMVALPIFLQTLLGYTAEQAGITMLPRGLGSFVGMPLVGVMIAKMDPRKMLAMGLVGAGVSLMALGRLDLNAGYWNLFWPQFFQGLFMAMLFVPLTTVTMDPIAPQEMGNATSLFNLLRNIGGSVGIATATTIIARRSQDYLTVLGRHVNPYTFQSQDVLAQMRSYFEARGADPFTALRQAYAAIEGMVQQQAALLSYLYEFKLFGIVFLIMLPLILMMRRPGHGGRPMTMH
ncbi:MAG TPA: DHA2 family efflux MFS transporter permease subunit [Bryobacteraceae bacterium]|nr:DHA2 family efflux MFS transporter permease subunit [Bryobacteraceae bacterium]